FNFASFFFQAGDGIRARNVTGVQTCALPICGKLSAFDSTDTSLDSTFKKAAFKLKTGEYTATPVKTQYGYHVILMLKNPGKGTRSEERRVGKECRSREGRVEGKEIDSTTV